MTVGARTSSNLPDSQVGWWSSLHILDTDYIENTASKSSSIVACLFIQLKLVCHCLVMAASICCTITAFSCHVTVCKLINGGLSVETVSRHGK
jgi:hypothetical protein